ncbi:MAG TPA: 50S ribosomal protein L32 [Blastocatellia bacterium]
MPNPKRKHSKSRTGMRRAHDHLTPPNTGNCPNCGEPRLPHRVCPKCKFYRGRVVEALLKEEAE